MAESSAAHDVWNAGSDYEAYVGRWSRLVALDFLSWLDVPPLARWLDMGCGPGTLVDVILERAAPRSVVGIDRSSAFVAHARARVTSAAAAFHVGDALALPLPDAAFDAVVSGLVLNFVPQPARMVSEMTRVARRGSTVALYVWDYAAGAEFIRSFWDAAKALDADAGPLDEAARFRICAPASLAALFAAAGLSGVETRAIEVPTRFRDFDDYWSPFLGGQGPAPAYAMSLQEGQRAALRDRIRSSLPVAADGSIRLTARAWAVRGLKPAPTP